MSDVDSTGVPLDQDEYDDPQSATADNPLASASPSAPSGGALSAVVTGSKKDEEQQVDSDRSYNVEIRRRIADEEGRKSDAYAEQKAQMQAAIDRLTSANFGPSDQEQQYRVAAALGSYSGGRGVNVSGVAAANADILEQRRQAELQKQQLLSQYATSMPQADIGMANSNINQLMSQYKLGVSQQNTDNRLAAKDSGIHGEGWVMNPTTHQWEYNPVMAQIDIANKAQIAQNAAKARMVAQQWNANGLVTPDMIELADNDLKSLPSAILRNPAAMVQINQGLAALHQQRGDAPGTFAAQQAMNREAPKVLDDYIKGQTHKNLDGINTAVQHIDVLRPLIDDLQNSPTSFVNTVKNTWDSKIMGKPAPSNFDGVKSFVIGEIAKATFPGGGGEAERQNLENLAKSSDGPDKLHDVINQFQDLLAGKLQYAKFNWDNSTGNPDGSFKYGKFEDRFLMPRTQQVLGIAPPANGSAARPGQTATPAASHPDPLVNKWLPQAPNATP